MHRRPAYPEWGSASRAPAPAPRAGACHDNHAAQCAAREKAEAGLLAERFVAGRTGATPVRRAELGHDFGMDLSALRVPTDAAAGQAAGRQAAHVARHRDRPAHIRRQPHVLQTQRGLRVQQMGAAEFERRYGVPTVTLSEQSHTPMSGLARNAGCVVQGSAAIMVTGLPPNARGVGFEGAHLWDFTLVDSRPQSVRGFRTKLLLRHILATADRSPLGPTVNPFSRLLLGKRATCAPNCSQSSGFIDDWRFPCHPKVSIVYRDARLLEVGRLGEFLDASAASMQGDAYAFNPHNEGSSAFVDTLGPGGPAPAMSNWVNRPAAQRRAALGLEADAPPPFMQPADATKDARWLDPTGACFMGDAPLGAGLTRARIGPAMSGASAIRVGDKVLLPYGACSTAECIAEAALGDERRPVFGGEAGGWAGALVCSNLSEALGTAFVRGSIGPGASFCVAGFGIAGDLLGDSGERAPAGRVNAGLDLRKETPRLIETLSVLRSAITGDDSARQYHQMREVEGGDSSP